MKHYNFREIKEHGSCIDFVEQILGAKVVDGRCVAVWRDGARDSVAIDREKWFDHAQQEGGGLIELCARKADFISKLQISLKEASETGYWLELLFRTNAIPQEQYKILGSACADLRVMLISSVKTLKSTAPLSKN